MLPQTINQQLLVRGKEPVIVVPGGAWNAIGNLADLGGSVNGAIRAEFGDGL
jgi:hypothetical protein